jgi:tetraacyldisaccharide 4'-kinase
MQAPGFWQRDGMLARLLDPIGGLVANATARRVAQPGWRAPVPVVCCGNAGVGGAGKTTLALDLGARLIRRGARVAFLTRGYRGRAVQGTLTVTPGHDSSDVGDEALLLAALAPTHVGPNRAASARVAVADGATVLVMDDGLQHGSLSKDVSFLVVDGGAGFGNGRVLPAGPLREPVATAAARCRAAVLIGDDTTHAAAILPHDLPVLRAWLRPETPALRGIRAFAFAGIGRPAKFFATVHEAGAELAGASAFPDHHHYRHAELRSLQRRALALDARLVTTAKDAVRLPAEWRSQVTVVDVSFAWADEAQIEALLGEIL